MITLPITLEKEPAKKVAEWLTAGRGVAVWQNQDLSSSDIGGLKFTPARTVEGEPVKSPHWNCGTAPEMVIEEKTAFQVVEYTQVYRVKVRTGPPYLGGIHLKDRDKLDTAMQKAGEGAVYHFDYERQYGSPWFTAIVSVPTSTVPLS
jgi:hypothetical protein